MKSERADASARKRCYSVDKLQTREEEKKEKEEEDADKLSSKNTDEGKREREVERSKTKDMPLTFITERVASSANFVFARFTSTMVQIIYPCFTEIHLI